MTAAIRPTAMLNSGAFAAHLPPSFVTQTNTRTHKAMRRLPPGSRRTSDQFYRTRRRRIATIAKPPIPKSTSDAGSGTAAPAPAPGTAP